MQQTALNTIAIRIFVITMFSLLVPLFKISPAVPALITAVILGLGTIDTLSLQGKGSTLLLDWLASFSPRHRERIIRHEAGHFLTAYFLGIPILGYTLTPWEALQAEQPGLGGVEFNTEEIFAQKIPTQEVPLLLERFCTVWMAGIAAEKLVYGSAEGGGEDKQKIKAALIALGYSESESPKKQQWASLQARNLLQKYNSSYEALVEAMARRASLDECYQVIQKQIES
ncbi:MAG: ATP-dependent Zn protease [Spirulinaceae cyanobacterium]